MCCVFTCCGWMIDLFQRLWTFTMSCCISSAVCCVLFASSMSGIAMGYNYSLAEYIDLKETNVSVYLKRGVFDDEMADDMDWRRSGRMPVAGHIKDSNLATDSGEETIPPRPARRMDDSLIQSDDQNKFEGSLMRLTAKPLDYASTKAPIEEDNISEVFEKYPKDSLDHLKAIHSLANMRRNNMNRATVVYADKTSVVDDRIILPGARRNLPEPPDSPDKHNIYINGRPVPYEHVTFKINPVRSEVPDAAVLDAVNWFMPKVTPPEYKRTMPREDYDDKTPHTYPTPIRHRNEPLRPTRVMSVGVVTKAPEPIFNERAGYKDMDTRRLENPELIKAQNNLLLDKANFPNFRKAEYAKDLNEDIPKSEDSDYEEQALKGFPMRSKRNIEFSTDEMDVNNASYKFVPNIIMSFLSKNKDEGKMEGLGETLLSERKTTVQDKEKFQIDLRILPNPNGDYKERAGYKDMVTRKLENPDLTKAQNNVLLDRANFSNFRKAENEKSQNDDLPKSEDSYYEEQTLTGFPMRSKRNIEFSTPEVDVKNASFKYVSNIIMSILSKKKDEGKLDDIGEKLSHERHTTVQDQEKFQSNLKISPNPNGNNTDNLPNGKSNPNAVKWDLTNVNNTMNFTQLNLKKNFIVITYE